jgi:hypothetical protein
LFIVLVLVVVLSLTSAQLKVVHTVELAAAGGASPAGLSSKQSLSGFRIVFVGNAYP